ncbi:hypothetical protein NQ314_015188 [Rhamnusium bicolor]|uniref:Insulin-like domain-containing protein n=1 Tax=Rhamnusium bicolor TaxID=1586634 RepID=A0AAV8WZM4_9CUCU|nr:hypothetical protein NQ314_015188 [Rhamnusium bicolor]
MVDFYRNPGIISESKMNCKIVLIVLMNILYVCSSPYLNHIMSKRSKFCGSKLTTALSLLCNGQYASPEKKSMADILNYEYDDDYNGLGVNEIEFPFLSKELAKSLVPQKIRRGGIVDECCHKSCTINELRSYCAK